MPSVTDLPADDTTCGWFHLSPPRTPRPAPAGRRHARWVVVGAGFTGLAAARRLAEHFPDEEIVLVEAQQVGFGSSGRNAGFAIDLPHDIGAADYIGDITIARKVLQLNLLGQTLLREQVRRHGIDCQWSDVGKYQAAVEPRGLAVLEAYSRGLEKLGQPGQLIEGDALPQHIGTSFYRRALYTSGTALVQPAALVKGLADSLPRNVTLHENTPITAVDYGRPVSLQHPRGQITADQLVLTNNAFGMSFGFLKGRMLPVFTYASLTRPLSTAEQQQLGGRPFLGLIPADPFGTTMRRTPDQRILVRNSFRFLPDGRARPEVLAQVVKRHRRSFERRFPMLGEVPFEHTWGCALSMAQNHQSQFGTLAPQVHGALCCNGLGVTRGTATGALLADWLAGERGELIDFLLGSPGPNRTPPRPFLSLGVNLNLMWGQHRAGLEA